jgi:hypothetical protein
MVRNKPTEFTNVFAVELWSDDEGRVLETLATAGNFYIAKAAFAEARRRHPGRPVLVRHGIRVVLHSREAPPSLRPVEEP